MEQWKLRERLVEDDKLVATLKIVRDYPGVSANKLSKLSNYATMTTRKKVKELEDLKLIRIEGEKKQACGKPNRHFITDLGNQMLRQVEKIPNPAAFVKIAYSDGFIEKLGNKKAREIQKIFGSTMTRNALSILISRLVFVLLNKEPGCACTFLDEYDNRLYFIGNLSDADSRTLKELIDKKVFSKEANAFKYIITTGMQFVKNVKKELNRDPQAFYRGGVIASLVTFKFNPETKNLVPIRAKFKKIDGKRYQIELPSLLG